MWIRVVVVVLGLQGAVASRAASITWELVPSSTTVIAGQSISADIVISGKPIGGPPSIGTFDFDVSFNPAILTPTDVIFGLFLGDPIFGEALTDFTFQPGIVDLAAVSLLSPAELDA